ncbi:hypothetical protein [Adlercreutzia sp. ZJ154]|uniref:hypothetical protein n=1 Tax=Adlercreutzia sp. ZJ154 TaxID=2709790 RepID=UPI0013EB6699|nr:hypothetical protein [Adlercreutzia sp. ZJ154]
MYIKVVPTILDDDQLKRIEKILLDNKFVDKITLMYPPEYKAPQCRGKLELLINVILRDSISDINEIFNFMVKYNIPCYLSLDDDLLVFINRDHYILTKNGLIIDAKGVFLHLKEIKELASNSEIHYKCSIPYGNLKEIYHDWVGEDELQFQGVDI